MATHLIRLCLLAMLPAFAPAHPLKMCVAHAQHNKNTGQFSLKFRFFWDDLEPALEKRTGKALDLRQVTAENNQIVSDFVAAYFHMKINDLPIVFKHRNSSVEDVVLVVEFTGEGFRPATEYKVEVQNSLLLDVYPEQYNLLRMDFFGNGNLETMRFERQERYLSKIIRQ